VAKNRSQGRGCKASSLWKRGEYDATPVTIRGEVEGIKEDAEARNAQAA